MRTDRDDERRAERQMEMDGDSNSGRILEHLALSLNQHSKLTAISVGFINMERLRSTHEHVQTHTH